MIIFYTSHGFGQNPPRMGDWAKPEKTAILDKMAVFDFFAKIEFVRDFGEIIFAKTQFLAKMETEVSLFTI
jgi:hypothetical protein